MWKVCKFCETCISSEHNLIPELFKLLSECQIPCYLGGWSKALLALLAPQKVWHLPKFWDDRG